MLMNDEEITLSDFHFLSGVSDIKFFLKSTLRPAPRGEEAGGHLSAKQNS